MPELGAGPSLRGLKTSIVTKTSGAKTALKGRKMRLALKVGLQDNRWSEPPQAKGLGAKEA